MTTQNSDIPLSTQQQVFTLSWLASQAPQGNSEEKDTKTPQSGTSSPWSQAALQAAIDNLRTQIPAWNWKVVWGPNYAVDLIGGPANTVYVAQQLDSVTNDPLPVYVVAIAGTNSKSVFDQVEDLSINSIDWMANSQDATGAQVTQGDMDGLKNLLGMLDLKTVSNILGFLSFNINNKSSTTLWFTGHSMGGALAPMLMLALMDPNSVLNTSMANLSHWQKVNLLATAGPSVGNAAYNDYFNRVLGAGNVTTLFVWNGNDTVPHAWDARTMNALMDPTTFETFYNITFPAPPTQDCVRDLLLDEQQKAAAQKYVQIAPTVAFTQPLQPYAPSDTWTPDAQFMAQLGYQHLNAYIQHFQCTWFSLQDPCAIPPAQQPKGKTMAGRVLGIRSSRNP